MVNQIWVDRGRELILLHVRQLGGCLLRAGERLGPVSGYAFVEREQAQHAVDQGAVCWVFWAVSPSCSWARRTRRQRGSSPRAWADAHLTARIVALHQSSCGTTD